MKTFLILVLFATTITASGQANFNYKEDFFNILAKTKNPSDKLYYYQLLNRFTGNDTTLTDYEVLALLIGFTNKPDYKPYQDFHTERKIHDLNLNKKFKAALKQSNKFLRNNPFSIKALLDKSFAFHKLEQKDSAAIYFRQVQCIFKAMQFSGGGETQHKSIFALGPADGEDYIQTFIGADIGSMGSGFDESGNFLDILEAKFKDGKKIYFSFIIQHASPKMFD